MTRQGFGAAHPKQSRPLNSKKAKPQTSIAEVKQFDETASNSKIPCSQLETQESPDQLALAWAAGVYNPLGNQDPIVYGARSLTVEEETWLTFATVVGWLEVEAGEDAIYYTAPPPQFEVNQADWYVLPGVTRFLDVPTLLHQVVRDYPIPTALIIQAVHLEFRLHHWSEAQWERFVWDLFDKPEADLTRTDWECLWFELQHQLENRSLQMERSRIESN